MNPFSRHPSRRRWLAAAALACLVAAPGLPAAEPTPTPVFPNAAPVCPCESLTNFARINTTIESAVVDPTNHMCRVTAIVTHPPSGDRVTVWIGLPLTNWNGRFQGTGGGGFLGGHPNNLRGPVARGFSAGATDTGHSGGSGSFALDADGRQDWQAIIDNAYLGIHEMTEVGKALTQAYYGKAPRYSYFVGGSTGGRQALMEAQRYPDDYDGILSACPAIHWHRFVPASLWPEVVMLTMSNFVSKAKLDAATAAAVKACDAADGVTEGVIDDPLRCDYDPKELVGTQVGDEVFTGLDAEVLRKIWQGPRGQGGRFLWYGLERGADLSAYAGTGGSPLKGKPFSIALEYWIYYLAQNPKWDWTVLSVAGFEQLWNRSVEQFGIVLGTDSPDLARFRDRGGKVIIYHGMADQLIPAAGTIDYYRRVQQQMGGAQAAATFARLFLVPGVDHGFRGEGAAPVGLNQAILRWVEEGIAPDQLLAEKRDASGRIVRSRPLFPYPHVARYQGTGSTDDAANFVRQLPAEKP